MSACRCPNSRYRQQAVGRVFPHRAQAFIFNLFLNKNLKITCPEDYLRRVNLLPPPDRLARHALARRMLPRWRGAAGWSAPGQLGADVGWLLLHSTGTGPATAEYSEDSALGSGIARPAEYSCSEPAGAQPFPFPDHKARIPHDLADHAFASDPPSIIFPEAPTT
uniref:Uncharacterized protein n=1 Tax=Setaria viridis TaxID=4556 RepID=A0A4U6UVE6_SETVI|nr:hypothetical protein SEVIR_4G097401v2 [Setaria viridis]